MDFIIARLYVLPGIIVGLSFHEFAHALVAHLLGDDTAKRLGRLTVDPIKHVDPLGLIMLMVAGFGWGKPVPVDERNFKHVGRDNLLVSLAGPLMNLLVATGFVIMIKIIFITNGSFFGTNIGGIIQEMLWNAVSINLVLMIFNLLPIPPLDGYHILSGIGDFRGRGIHYQLYDKGRFALLGVVALSFLGIPVFDIVIGTPVRFVFKHLVGIFF